jgi:hypothetical protein
VYDIGGRQVAVLANGRLPAGYHQRLFNAARSPAGIYLLKLVCDGKVITKKIVKE